MNKQKKILSVAAISTIGVSIAAMAPMVTTQIHANPTNTATFTMKYQELKNIDVANGTPVDIDSEAHTTQLSTTAPLQLGDLKVNANVTISDYVKSATGQKRALMEDPTALSFSDINTGTDESGKWNYCSAKLSSSINPYSLISYSSDNYSQLNAIKPSELLGSEDNALIESVAFSYIGFENTLGISVGDTPVSDWTSQITTETENGRAHQKLLLTDPNNKYKIEISNIKNDYSSLCTSSSHHNGFNSDKSLDTNDIFYTPETQAEFCGQEAQILTDTDVKIKSSDLHFLYLTSTQGNVRLMQESEADLFNITIYQRINDAPTVTLNDISDQHFDANGHDITISGTAADANQDEITVSIYNGENKLGTVTPDSNGDWTYNINTKNMPFDSTQTISVIAGDGDLSSEKVSKSFKITNTPAEITINNVSEQEYSKSSKIITVSGTWSDSDTNPSDTITGTVKVDNGTAKNIIVNADGTWSCNIDIAGLSIGSHIIYVTASDNISGSCNKETALEIKDTTPSITINDIPNQHYDANGHTVTISGTVNNPSENDVSITVYNGNTELGKATISDNTWSFDINTSGMSLGSTQTITVQADNGNLSSEKTSKSFNITNTPTQVTINKIEEQQFIGTDKELSLSGTWEDVDSAPKDTITGELFIDNKSVGNIVINNDGTWSHKVNIKNIAVGEHTVLVSATDGISEAGQSSTVLKITNSVPTLVVNSSDSILEGEDYPISVTVTDLNMGQEISYYYSIDDNDKIKAGTISSNGLSLNIPDFKISSSKLSVGTHTITISVSDGIASDSKNVQVVVKEKNVAPIITIGELPNQQYSTEANEVHFNVNATDQNNDALELSATLNGIDIAPTAIKNLGNGKYDIAVDLAGSPIGNYSLMVTANDGEFTKSEYCNFAIINSVPKISATVPSDIILLDQNPNINVDFNITDINIGQNISVEYQINDNEWKNTGIDFLNSSSTSHINVDIPLSIDLVGNNKIKFRIYDGFEYDYDNGPDGQGYNIVCNEQVSASLEKISDIKYTTKSNMVVIKGHTNNQNSEIRITSNDNVDYYVSDIDENGDFTISFDAAGLSVGTHSFEYSASNNETSVANKYSYTISNTKPTLSVSELKNAYNIEKINDINVTLDVIDENIGQEISVYYRLYSSSSKSPEWTQYSTISSDGNNSIQLTLPINNLDVGEYDIEFMVHDDVADINNNYDEVTCFKTIKLFKTENTNVAPVVSILKMPNTITAGDSMTINLDIEEPNIGDEVFVYRRIDNNAKELITSFISNGKIKNINDTINSLSIGKHSIEYTCVDISGEQTSDMSNVEVIKKEEPVSTTPKITLALPNTGVSGQTINLKIDITDLLENETFNLYRTIDDNKELIGSYKAESTYCNISDSISQLSIGTHNIKYSLVRYNGETIECSKKINIVSEQTITDISSPILYISNIKSSFNMGQGIDVSLICDDSDIGKDIEIYYELDNQKPVKLKSFTSNGKKKTFDFNIKNDLDLGNHSIVFYAVDEYDNYSNLDGDIKIDNIDKYKPSEDMANKITFEINNSTPTLTITKFSDKVKNNETLTVDFIVQDLNIGQKINCYYMLDNAWPVKITDYISNGKEVTLSAEIQSLSVGKHTITLFAEDDLGGRSNSTGDNISNVNSGLFPIFNKTQGNQFVIEIVQSNTAPLVEIIPDNTDFFENEDVVIPINIKDDKNQKTSLYYSIDNSSPVQASKITASGQMMSQRINIGKLSAGKHTVSIWAEDSDGLRSDSTSNSFDNISSIVISIKEAAKEKEAEIISTGINEDTSSGLRQRLALLISGMVLSLVAFFKIKSNKNK